MTARLSQKFVNPSNGDEYLWPVNHFTEEGAGVQRTVTKGANTASTGLVRQQADDQPFTFQLGGTIFSPAQLEAFKEWYILCKTQTIYFYKFDGDKYEVTITDFKPSQKYTVKNPKSADAPLWYWTYTMSLDVVRVIEGVWEGIVT